MILAWMGYAILTGALLAVAAFAIEWALRAYRLPTRWIWVVAIVLSVLGPLAAFRMRGTSAPVETQVDSMLPAVPGDGTPHLTMPSFSLGLDDPASLARLDRPVVIVWLIASMLLAARFGVSLVLLARRRRGWQTDEVDGMPVRIARDVGPAVVGFLDPAIVLPGWIRTLDQRLLRLVVAHEQEHLRKGDSRLTIAAGVLVVLAPWNLPLWWQIRRLRLAVEIDCDGRVLAVTPEVASYAGLLCELGAMRSRSRVDSISLGQSALIRPAAFLERRIRHMTASVPHHRRWKTLGVGVVAVTSLGFATLPDPPPATAGGAQPAYHLLVADIEYRNAESAAEFPSVYVIVPSQHGEPERQWHETYEAYEDMTIVDRQIMTREEVCYTTREPDGTLRMRTRSTVPEIDSLTRIPDNADAVAQFLSGENSGKEVNYMAYTVQERAVCFLLGGETDEIGTVEAEPASPSEDGEDSTSENSKGRTPRDTIDFEPTPFVDHPVCLAACSIQPFFEARVGSTFCNVVVGIHIDERGRVDGVDMLKRGAVAGCDEAAEAWAHSTRWSPARSAGGRTVPAWIAQPLRYEPLEEA